ncbi:MAG: peptide chain release factor N(5)-glutamine methyltransferase [Thermodesulfovibrionales bacterium]
MRLLDALRSATERLERAGVEDPHVDAELLVLHAAGLGRLAAYTENPEIDRRLVSRINSLVRRRLRSEPVQYITGSVEFLGLRIRVGKGVLIPRPETELLVQEAVTAVHSSRFKIRGFEKKIEHGTSNAEPVSVLDLCTGSGCIALAIGREFPDARVMATDISAKALRYARRNAEENGIANVEFLKGSLFAPLKKGACFDLIISNPPYVRTAAIDALQPEVRDWEPRAALDGGDDGLGFYRAILDDAAARLNTGGTLLLEIGFDQGAAVNELAIGAGLADVSVIRDYAGLDRIVKARKTLSS